MKKEEEERETYTEESGKTSKMKELKPAKKRDYSSTTLLYYCNLGGPR